MTHFQNIFQNYQRQIHLDFHTSPFIPNVASEFDAREFAQTLKQAHVNSVTVFAKCHHGMCYYPSKSGTVHPAIGERDLLGEQIEALHREGIRAPIYTTVVWEEDAAQRFPQWRQMRQDGTFAGTRLATDNSGPHPGAWKWMNFLHPEYQDYFEAHLREVLERYGSEVDGFFVDILMMHRTADWSEPGIQFREERGLMGADAKTHAQFESAAQVAFGERFTRLIHGARPEATVFYNSGHHLFTTAEVGSHARVPISTHFEVESLPSGFWGYFHFPRMARLVETWPDNDGQGPLPWLAMTGRFQKQWGDFGGIKPQPALEFECFRAQALGGANSVGDQLPPRGRLEAAAYKLIGAVYEQVAQAEPFYAGSHALPQVGIVYPGALGGNEGEADKSIEGAIQMCGEAHYECVVLDDAGELDGLDLVILPDSVDVTPRLAHALAAYYNNGGKLLLSHNSALGQNGEATLPFLPLSFQGEAERWPTFWRAKDEFAPDLAGSDRVVYARGRNVSPDGVEVLVERALPYFQRTDVRFCSHFQTPPQAQSDAFPAVVAGERFVYFADPIFREYRQAGNIAARDGWRAAMTRLIGQAPFGDGLPTTVLVVPRRRENDLLLTLLHYIPIRKSLDIDIIEERSSFAGLTLRLPDAAQSVRVVGGDELAKVEGGFALPSSAGRLLLEVPGFFGG